MCKQQRAGCIAIMSSESRNVFRTDLGHALQRAACGADIAGTQSSYATGSKELRGLRLG